MSDPTSPTPGGPGWTVETLRIHLETARNAEEKFQNERDRRYAEQWRHQEQMEIERRRTAKVKERAEHVALSLASEIQKYKDEKANELRSQISNERGLYATNPIMDSKLEGVRKELFGGLESIKAEIKPLSMYYNAQQGPRAITWPMIAAAVSFVFLVIGGVISVIVFLSRPHT